MKLANRPASSPEAAASPGRPCARDWEEVGYRAFGFDRPGLPHPPEMTEAVACDLTDDGSVNDALKRVAMHGSRRISSVVHPAAYYNSSGERSDLYDDDVTVCGTRRLLTGFSAWASSWSNSCSAARCWSTRRSSRGGGSPRTRGKPIPVEDREPDTARVYERAKPQKETGMGRLDSPATTPHQRPDQLETP